MHQVGDGYESLSVNCFLLNGYESLMDYFGNTNRR